MTTANDVFWLTFAEQMAHAVSVSLFLIFIAIYILAIYLVVENLKGKK